MKHLGIGHWESSRSLWGLLVKWKALHIMQELYNKVGCREGDCRQMA